MLIDQTVPLFYHLTSRCVQRAFLFGIDPVTGKDYSHRKEWLVERLHHLVQIFAVELHGYSIMSNHFHLCIYYDPQVHLAWTDEEVADRWLALCPPRTSKKKGASSALLSEQKTALLSDARRLAHVRKQLGSVSTFMKFLKQPIARRANAEEKTSGHFFEQRFWSGALLTDRAVKSAMLYIDLNPSRALIARCVEDIKHCGITERLMALAVDPVELEAFLKPLVSGLGDRGRVIPIQLGKYVDLLQAFSIARHEAAKVDSPEDRWARDVASIHKRQRAYGDEEELRAWCTQRNWKRVGDALTE